MKLALKIIFASSILALTVEQINVKYDLGFLLIFFIAYGIGFVCGVISERGEE